MFTDSTPNQRASRVAIAGSIYMRRASLELSKPKQNLVSSSAGLQNSIRNPSYGKIVRNGQKKTEDQITDVILTGYSRKTGTPLLDKKNILSNNFEVQYKRKTPTPSFGHFEDIQNTKIKAIQQKYRHMLSDYQSKKKAINSELNSLKSSTLLQKNKTLKQQYQTNNDGRQIKNNNYVKQYQTKSKELIIEKFSVGAKQLNTKKKEKVADKYPRFFKALRNQILLEEQLRGIRASINPEKKQEIQKILSATQLTKDQKLLQMDPEQFDPFQNRKTSQLSAAAQASKLINKFQQCQTHWKQNVCNISISQAKEIFQSLNFEKTQQISLKSFVRQLSFLLEKHLRNRDLLKIYSRLNPLTQHNFSRIVSTKQ